MAGDDAPGEVVPLPLIRMYRMTASFSESHDPYYSLVPLTNFSLHA
jgi:hypothetical protein